MTHALIIDILLWVFAVFIVGWIVWQTLAKADNIKSMIIRWILTAVILAFLFFKVAPIVGEGGWDAAMTGIPVTALCGLALALVWRHAIASLIAKPFASLYDGGDTPPEPKPVYYT